MGDNRIPNAAIQIRFLSQFIFAKLAKHINQIELTMNKFRINTYWSDFYLSATFMFLFHFVQTFSSIGSSNIQLQRRLFVNLLRQYSFRMCSKKCKTWIAIWRRNKTIILNIHIDLILSRRRTTHRHTSKSYTARIKSVRFWCERTIDWIDHISVLFWLSFAIRCAKKN